MFKKVIEKVEEKVDKIDTSAVSDTIKETVAKVDTDKVAKVVKDTAVGAVEEGVEVVKGGIFGIINGILFKIVATVVFIVIILSAGCIGTSVTIDKLTSDDTPTEQTLKKDN